LNQVVSLYEFGITEEAFSPACQTNCFQGEASAVYDPCGNMISLVANSTGAEVWARAVDKNSNQAIGSYNPHAIEMPFVGDGTVMPPYEEPIVSPIAFTIGKGGFNVKDHLASNTDLTIAIGQNGANASIYGDDDCGDEMCGEATEREHACEDDESDWYEYCNCVVNCFSSGDTKTIDTSENPENLKMFQEWEGLDGEVNDLGFGALVSLISAYLFASTSVGVTAVVSCSAIVWWPIFAAIGIVCVGTALTYLYHRKKWTDFLKENAKYLKFRDSFENTYMYYDKLEDDCC
jgi:hypothetical protein